MYECLGLCKDTNCKLIDKCKQGQEWFKVKEK